VRSLRAQIVDAAIALLNTSPPAGIPFAERIRFEPYGPEDLPAINVMPVREESEKKTGRWGPLLTRGFTLRVECRVSGSPADVILDPLLVWAGQSLGGQDFGLLAEDCYETLCEWSYAGSDQNYSMASLDFRINFSTLSNDPTRNSLLTP